MNTFIKTILLTTFTISVWIRFYSFLPVALPLQSALYYTENVGRGASLLYGVSKAIPATLTFLRDQIFTSPPLRLIQDWQNTTLFNKAQLEQLLRTTPHRVTAQHVLNAGYISFNEDELRACFTPQGITYTIVLRPDRKYLTNVRQYALNHMPTNHDILNPPNPYDFDVNYLPPHLRVYSATPKELTYEIPFKKLTKDQKKIFIFFNGNTTSFDDWVNAGALPRNLSLSDEFRRLKISRWGKILNS